MKDQLKIIYVTCDTLDRAKEISRALLEENLIACANIIPGVQLLYRWKGKIMEEGEVAVLMKTSRDKASKAMKRIETLHTYDVPAVEIWDVEEAPEAFTKWVRSETA